MSLPKIDQPLFEMKIPSNNKVVKFRPFLVKEEKLLLIAQQSESDRDILRAIKQVLNNCIVDDINVDDLATFDLEYMFLKLRSKSVNNIVKLSYRDNEDDQVYEFEVDLDDIEITMKEQNNKIKINDNMGIIMKYPAAAITEQMTEFENEIDLLMFFVKKCIDTIYDEDNVYPAAEASEAELEAFIDSLNLDTFQKIREFFDAMPQLYHKLEYTNKMGHERTIELNNLRDFFMWG